MNHLSLFESPVKRGAGLIAPALHLITRVDKHIGRNPQRAQNPPQSNHFRGPIGHFLFDDQKIKVGIFLGIPARLRAEQPNLGRRRDRLGQDSHGFVDDTGRWHGCFFCCA